MRIRTAVTATGIALGLTLTGAAAASAAQTPDGWSPATWTQHMMRMVGSDADPDATPGGYGWDGDARPADATGDPSTCPYADDATADRPQDRDRDRLRAQDGTGDVERRQMRERMHVSD